MTQVIKAGMGSLPFFKNEDDQAAEDAKAEGKSIEQVQAWGSHDRRNMFNKLQGFFARHFGQEGHALQGN